MSASRSDAHLQCLRYGGRHRTIPARPSPTNQITGVETLASLTWLSSLELRGNRIEDLKPLAKLRELRLVFLEDNRIADLGPLVEAAQADAKGEKRFAPFLRLYIAGNPLNEESKKALETLKGIGVRVTTGPRARKL